MRINAARDVAARAWPRFSPHTVQIAIGVVRVTASPEEALDFARQLTEAATATVRPTDE
ncbi:hypothetical protein ACXYX3_11325 [Mycobacterium sp. C3-094]